VPLLRHIVLVLVVVLPPSPSCDFVERCLASPFAEATEDKCEADSQWGVTRTIGYGGQAVLESWRAVYWSTGVLEFCALSELHPANTGLQMLSGHTV
jgi:hypothetical protein